MKSFRKQTEFEFDASNAQLGSKLPKEITKGSNRALFKDIGKWAVESRVIHLQHGMYEGKAVSLIVFDFTFRYEESPSGLSRLESADIRISFDPHPDEHLDAAADIGEPSVVNFSHTYPSKCRRQRRGVLRIPLGTTGGLGAAQAGVNLDKATEGDSKKTKEMTVQLEVYSTELREETHLLVWTVRENPVQKEGIPNQYKARSRGPA